MIRMGLRRCIDVVWYVFEKLMRLMGIGKDMGYVLVRIRSLWQSGWIDWIRRGLVMIIYWVSIRIIWPVLPIRIPSGSKGSQRSCWGTWWKGITILWGILYRSLLKVSIQQSLKPSWRMSWSLSSLVLKQFPTSPSSSTWLYFSYVLQMRLIHISS